MKKMIVGFAVIITLLTIGNVSALPPTNWTLQVVFPSQDYLVTTPFLYIHVNPQGYRLDIRYAGTPNLPNVGHYDKLIDGRLIDMSDRQNDLISMVGVTQGPHVLTLVPARNNNSEISGSAVNISFVYAGPFLPQPGPFTYDNPPSLLITAPVNGSTVLGGTFDMTVDIQNFFLSAESFGKEMVDGVGHWEIYVDLPPMNCTCDHNSPEHMEHMKMMLPYLKAYASTNTWKVFLKGLEPNKYHTFTAILVDNQHMHIMPMVMDMVTLYVAN